MIISKCLATIVQYQFSVVGFRALAGGLIPLPYAVRKRLQSAIVTILHVIESDSNLINS